MESRLPAETTPSEEIDTAVAGESAAAQENRAVRLAQARIATSHAAAVRGELSQIRDRVGAVLALARQTRERLGSPTS